MSKNVNADIAEVTNDDDDDKAKKTAVLLPNILVEHCKSLLKDGQTFTDYVKMSVARSSKFDVSLLPVSKSRATLPRFYSAAEIKALVASKNTTKLMEALASNEARELKIKENLKIARDKAKAEKTVNVNANDSAYSFDEYGMPIAM